MPKKTKPVPHEHSAVAVVERQGRLLLARRPVDVRLGGMWEFPGTLRHRGESTEVAAERAVREGLGLLVRPGDHVGVVEHGFTHVRVSYHAVRCSLVGGEARALGYDAWTWAASEELERLALPLAQKKIASLATEPTLFSG